MQRTSGGRTAEDQNREPLATITREIWQHAADLNPDDFDPDSEDGLQINPCTGLEYGEIDNTVGAIRHRS